MKIKIIQDGWAGYTGNIGAANFVDGISETDELTAKRISANVQIENLEDGSLVSLFPDASYRYIGAVSEKLEVETPVEEALVAEETPVELEELHKYTREELEVIADEKGVSGLREIATPLGVKGVSISNLVDGILKVQAE